MKNYGHLLIDVCRKAVHPPISNVDLTYCFLVLILINFFRGAADLAAPLLLLPSHDPR